MPISQAGSVERAVKIVTAAVLILAAAYFAALYLMTAR